MRKARDLEFLKHWVADPHELAFTALGYSG